MLQRENTIEEEEKGWLLRVENQPSDKPKFELEKTSNCLWNMMSQLLITPTNSVFTLNKHNATELRKHSSNVVKTNSDQVVLTIKKKK